MRSIIEEAWENRELLKEEATVKAIEDVIEEIVKDIINQFDALKQKIAFMCSNSDLI